jgi:hypothetical protein
MSGPLVSLLIFFFVLVIGMMMLVAPLTMVFHGASWQMIVALIGGSIFFAIPFQALKDGKIDGPLIGISLVCLVLALQGWAFALDVPSESDALRASGRSVGEMIRESP